MTIMWEDVSNNDYLNSAFSNENRITVVWKPQPIDNAKSRKCLIASSSDWHDIGMSGSFVPKYKDAKAPDYPTAKIFTLGEYYTNATSEHKQTTIQLVNSQSLILQITTAYDTIFNSRLIIDVLSAL